MQGYVKIHRRLKEHWLFQEERPKTKLEAWIDLVLSANHADAKFMLGSDLVEVSRGQHITSIRKLSASWKWSNTKVTTFLRLLESDGMIVVKNDAKKTLLTIANYDFWQGCELEKATEKRHENDAETTQKHTNKNEKNVENEKKEEETSSRRKYIFDECHMGMAKFFYSQLLTHSPDVRKPNFESWADEFRKLHLKDLKSRGQDEGKKLIFLVMDFCTNDPDNFEQANVQSPSKMRKRWTQLLHKAVKWKRGGQQHGQGQRAPQRSEQDSIARGVIGHLNPNAHIIDVSDDELPDL